MTLKYRYLMASTLMAIAFSAVQGSGTNEDGSDWFPPDRRILMAAGTHDFSDADLSEGGFAGITEHTIDTADGRFRDDFPAGQYWSEDGIHPKPQYDAVDVMKLTILFDIRRDDTPVTLRMARAGRETSLVTLNGKSEYRVTWDMLGSAEGFKVGTYDLYLGELDRGGHSLVLEVESENPYLIEDFAWDAIVLFRD